MPDESYYFDSKTGARGKTSGLIDGKTVDGNKPKLGSASQTAVWAAEWAAKQTSTDEKVEVTTTDSVTVKTVDSDANA